MTCPTAIVPLKYRTPDATRWILWMRMASNINLLLSLNVKQHNSYNNRRRTHFSIFLSAHFLSDRACLQFNSTLMHRWSTDQLVLFPNRRTFWQREQFECVVDDTDGCVVSAELFICEMSSAAFVIKARQQNPILDPVIKQPGLTPAPSKPRLLRRSLAMIILWFTEREKTINLNSMFTHSRISAEII